MKTPAVKGLFAAASAVALTAGVPLLAVAEEVPKPYDAIVDYVESTGTQRVDTGIKLGSTHTVVLKFASLSDGYVICAYNAAFMLLSRTLLANGDEYLCVLDNKDAADRIRLVAAKSAGRVHELKFGPQGYYLDGIRMPPRTRTFAFSCADTATLFGSATAYSSVRLWGCQIYNGETLVADFRPVRKDGVGRLYDVKSEKLLATGGTGALTAGPVSSAQEFKELTFTKDVTKMNQRLKYIESTGVQAMTTDVKSGTDTEMMLSYSFPNKPIAESRMMYGFCGVGALPIIRIDRMADTGFEREWMRFIIADSENSVTTSPEVNVNSNDHVLVVRSREYVLDGAVGTLSGTLTKVGAGTETLFSMYCDFSINMKDGAKTVGISRGIWHNSTADICGCPMRVYSYKMKKAGKLIRHLVPMRTAIGVGMWDKVENRFHPCISESADFIAGPPAPGLALFIK